MPRFGLRNTLMLFGLYAAVTPSSVAGDGDGQTPDTVGVKIVTDQGTIHAELDPKAAPATVANFLEYARTGFFAGTVFHRVIPGFMIQGGGLGPGLQRRPTGAPVRNESGNGISNERGVLAMARTNDPDSATSQFFINLADNQHLDGRAGQPGYTAFGRVTAGMDVVDAIAAVATTSRGGHRDVPVEPVTITAVEITGPKAGDEQAGGGSS